MSATCPGYELVVAACFVAACGYVLTQLIAREVEKVSNIVLSMQCNAQWSNVFTNRVQ